MNRKHRKAGERLWRTMAAAALLAAIFWAFGAMAATVNAQSGAQPGAQSGAQPGAPSGRSIWEGVYTEVQAGDGEAIFAAECTRCHSTADFAGELFLRGWNGRTAHDLFNVIRMTMPQDNPGSLGTRSYVDVLAYIFRSNQIPAGETALSLNEEDLKQIRFEPKPVED